MPEMTENDARSLFLKFEEDKFNPHIVLTKADLIEIVQQDYNQGVIDERAELESN